MIDTPAIEKLLGELEALHEKATPGPWETDSEYDGDGLASCGGGCTTGWHNYFIGAEVDGKWRTLLDTVNSDHKLIEDDRDEDGGRSWDAIGHANANLVAEAVNCLPILITTIRALMEAVEGERERCAKICEARAATYSQGARVAALECADAIRSKGDA